MPINDFCDMPINDFSFLTKCLNKIAVLDNACILMGGVTLIPIY